MPFGRSEQRARCAVRYAFTCFGLLAPIGRLHHHISRRIPREQDKDALPVKWGLHFFLKLP